MKILIDLIIALGLTVIFFRILVNYNFVCHIRETRLRISSGEYQNDDAGHQRALNSISLCKKLIVLDVMVIMIILAMILGLIIHQGGN